MDTVECRSTLRTKCQKPEACQMCRDEPPTYTEAPKCPVKACPGPGHCEGPEDCERRERIGGSNWKDTNPKDGAAAAQGRVPISVFPDTAIIAGAMAMWEGAQKYGRFNYRVVGVGATTYLDALERHVKAWKNGEDIDPDSGLSHLWKALACLAILIDAEECDMLTDDRPPRAPVADMLNRLKPVVKDIEKRLEEYTPHQYTIEDSPDD